MSEETTKLEKATQTALEKRKRRRYKRKEITSKRLTKVADKLLEAETKGVKRRRRQRYFRKYREQHREGLKEEISSKLSEDEEKEIKSFFESLPKGFVNFKVTRQINQPIPGQEVAYELVGQVLPLTANQMEEGRFFSIDVVKLVSYNIWGDHSPIVKMVQLLPSAPESPSIWKLHDDGTLFIFFEFGLFSLRNLTDFNQLKTRLLEVLHITTYIDLLTGEIPKEQYYEVVNLLKLEKFSSI